MPKKKPVGESEEAPALTPEGVLERLTTIGDTLTELLKPLTAETQSLLDGLEGQSFGLEANLRLTAAIQLLLHRLGLRVKCVKCGEAAQIRCRETGNAKGGSFQFEHTHGKQTNHGGGTTFPKLQLVPAPADPRRKRKSRA
jgi:hypothetical protein